LAISRRSAANVSTNIISIAEKVKDISVIAVIAGQKQHARTPRPRFAT